MADYTDPMLSDELGNPTLPDPNNLDSILEAYKRLKEFNSGGNTKPVTQTIKTDPRTGEETFTISGTARDLSPANPLTPTVMPAGYNQYIGQQESGNNPMIGFHDLNKSTAYGQFGITQPAWQDIQRVSPQFAGRDITTLSPQEQVEANNILRSQYAQQLQSKGVEPTEANLRLAHLMGAGGAHQFLTSGTVSPEAAAANGGEAKLKQIAQSRLASVANALNPISTAQAAGTEPTLSNTPLAPEADQSRSLLPGYNVPATNPFAGTPSAAMPGQTQVPAGPVAPVAPGQTTQDVTQPETTLNKVVAQEGEQAGPPTSLMTPQGWAERFATSQQNPKMVADMAFDPNAPQWVRGAAEQHLGNFIAQKRAESAAQNLLTKAQETGDFRQVGTELNKPTEEGSWLKYILFRHMGLGEASQNEAVKLGLLNTTHVANGPDGEHGLITYNGRGMPVSGITADNKPIAPEQLNAWASLGENNAAMLKSAQTQAIQTFANTKNYLQKKAFEIQQAMGPGYDLSQDGLAPNQIQARATADAQAVMNQARATRTAVATNTPMGLPQAIPQGGTAGYTTGATTAQPLVNGVEVPTAAGAEANQQRVKSIAEKIANYEMPAPQSRSGPYATIMREVSRLNPDYDSTKFATAQAARKEFTRLAPNSGGGQLQAVNRAIPHMAQYEEAVKALDNGQMPAVNSILNSYGYNVGNDKVAAAQAISHLVSTEVQKAVTGGLGGVGEREDLAKQLSSNLNPQQLARVIHEYQGLMAAQAQGLKQNWTSNGLPEKEFDSKLVPKAREVVKRHEREMNNTRSNW